MNVFEVLQLVGGLILSIGTIPQIEQIVRTKSAKDLNVATILSLIVGLCMMQVYAIHENILMFAITNGISLILAVTQLVLKIYYEKGWRFNPSMIYLIHTTREDLIQMKKVVKFYEVNNSVALIFIDGKPAITIDEGKEFINAEEFFLEILEVFGIEVDYEKINVSK